MWEISAVGDPSRTDLVYQEASLEDATNSSSPEFFLGQVLGIEPESLAKIQHAIPTWLRPSEEIDEQFVRRIPADSSEWTRAVEARIPTADRTLGAVWIDHSYVLVQKPEGVSELQVVYTASDWDHSRTLKIEAFLKGPSTATLEWYAAIGDSTTVMSGEAALRGSGRVKRALLNVSEKAGWLVGRVVRNRANTATREQSDPLHARRRQELEGRAAALAKLVPDIRTLANQAEKTTRMRQRQIHELVVLVHGTVSCAMRMLCALNDSGLPPPKNGSWVRYEHDTFLPVGKNSDELVSAISKLAHSVRPRRILLLCHSRGGLVGVMAVHRILQAGLHRVPPLSRRPRPKPEPFDPAHEVQFEVCTFGTPHRGTPLAAGAAGIMTTLRALAASSARMAFSSLGLDPVGWIFGWAMSRIDFPRGVAAMAPGSDFMDMYSRLDKPFSVSTAGGYFDAASDADGFFAVAKEAALAEVMGGKRHDGVVALDSSLAAGEAMYAPLLQCGHGDYFGRPEVIDPLRCRLESGRWS